MVTILSTFIFPFLMFTKQRGISHSQIRVLFVKVWARFNAHKSKLYKEAQDMFLFLNVKKKIEDLDLKWMLQTLGIVDLF